MRYMVFARALSVVVMCGAASVVAAESEVALTPDFLHCMKASGAVDPAILECQSKEWERQDKRLNEAYRKLLAKLPPAKVTELRVVQRMWLAFAEAKCKFYYDGEEFNGTLNRIEAQYCSVAERARRADELERLAKW